MREKILCLLLTALLIGSLSAQTSCTGYTQPTGAVIGNQVVTLMPVNAPGFCYAQGFIYYPDDYNLPANSAKKYPILVTLNGAGQGQSQDISELNTDFIPQLIAQGLKPYGIDPTTGDTIKYIIVSPHCAGCNGAYSYPQLKYTIPWLLKNLRVDTTCVWVTGLSQGGRGTVSCIMGDALGDTALGLTLTGVVPLSSAGYDNAMFAGTGQNRNLDTILKRGCYVKYAIGGNDQNNNQTGFIAYDSVYRQFCLPGRYADSVYPNIGHSPTVWSSMWPLNARIFNPKTQSIWTQMWVQRKNAAPTQLSVYAGADQTITLPQDSILLSGIGTPAPGTSIASYLWAKVSGPNTPTLVTAAQASTMVRGLIAGTYQFSLQVTSSVSTTAKDTVQIIVQAAAVVGPTASAGTSQTIFQPVSSANITGNGTAGSSAIVTHTWIFVSGPVTPTIVTPSNYTTNVTGMSTVGTYVFKLKVTDGNGLSDSSNTQISVINPPPPSVYITDSYLSEYLCAHRYSDSSVRTYIFNNNDGKVEFTPYIIGGLKSINGAPLFNRMALMDQNNYVWTSTGGTPTCTRINVDTFGTALNYCDRIYGYFYGLFWISKDSTTILYGGTDVNGMQGDTYNFYGHPNNSVGNKPVRFHAPAGKKWVKMALGAKVLALTSTGEVWAWQGGTGTGSSGKGDTNYVQITGFTGKAVDIAASQGDFYGILVHDYVGGDTTQGNPYVFGSQASYWGGTTSTTTATPARTLWGLTQACRQISMNNNTIHVIDSSRRMFGTGDNPNGEVGIGTERVNKFTYGTPYAWSWIKNEMQIGAPMQQIGAGIIWDRIFSGNAFAFYHWALDTAHNAYNWGRDKSFIGGKGLVNNNEVSTPNSLDVLAPKITTPEKNTPATGFNFQLPNVNVGTKHLTINTSTTTLSATGTPASSGAWGYSVAQMLWTKQSGPTCTIATPLSTTATASTQVTGMTSGSYVFICQMTDNNTGTWQDTVFITVTGTVFTPPTVTTSGNQTIILPISNTSINASVTPHGASIVSNVWSKLQGPVAGTITTPGSLTTTITGLVAGSYTFRMTATDSNGQVTTSDLVIAVSTLSNFCNCLTAPIPLTFPNQ